jgi:hypothetical protein
LARKVGESPGTGRDLAEVRKMFGNLAGSMPSAIPFVITGRRAGKYLSQEEHGQPATAGIFHLEFPIFDETEADGDRGQGE